MISVIDLKISAPIAQPWEGAAPVSAQSSTTAQLMATLEQRLAQEIGGTIGFVLAHAGLSTIQLISSRPIYQS